MTIPTTERYYSWREPVRRIGRRKKLIPSRCPVPYEIHFAADSIAKSLAHVESPTTNIATIFSIHACKTKLHCRNGVAAIIYGNEGNEELYYCMTWNDVMENPYAEKYDGSMEQMERKIDRLLYPHGSLKRVENKRLIYYLRKAAPEDLHQVVNLLKETTSNQQK